MIKCRCDLQLDTKLRVTPPWSLNLVGGEVSPASWPWAPLVELETDLRKDLRIYANQTAHNFMSTLSTSLA